MIPCQIHKTIEKREKIVNSKPARFSIPFTSRVLPNRHHRITNIWNFLFPLPISRYNVIQLFIQVGLVFGGQQQRERAEKESGRRDGMQPLQLRQQPTSTSVTVNTNSLIFLREDNGIL
jgi:hypothetical protein